VTRHGVWLGNWIYWTLITRNYNYNAVTNSPTLLLTPAHTKPSQFATPSLVVAWQWIPSVVFLCFCARVLTGWPLACNLFITPTVDFRAMAVYSLAIYWLTDWLMLNCCWSSPAQWFLVPNPTGLVIVFYYLTDLDFFRPLLSSRLTDGLLNCCWFSPVHWF
jgi:hypothetical protein